MCENFRDNFFFQTSTTFNHYFVEKGCSPGFRPEAGDAKEAV